VARIKNALLFDFHGNIILDPRASGSDKFRDDVEVKEERAKEEDQRRQFEAVARDGQFKSLAGQARASLPSAITREGIAKSRQGRNEAAGNVRNCSGRDNPAAFDEIMRNMTKEASEVG